MTAVKLYAVFTSTYWNPLSLIENWVTPIWVRVSNYENIILLLHRRSIILFGNINDYQPIKKNPVSYKRECSITAFTRGHHLIVCTSVTVFRFQLCVVRVFAVLRYYAAYILFAYRRFGANNLPNLQGSKSQLSSPALRIKYILAFKDGTDRPCRNFGKQLTNFVA